jgi:UDP-N-acetylmuramoyl-L-alanyl-D-glutamate--2,6-diaminopimelate ligase
MDVRLDSKLVESGDIFVGMKCEGVDSNVAEAIANGARVVFAEGITSGRFPQSNIITVSDARMTASTLARLRYPLQPECCVAVTGTHGKSSVVHFLRQIWTKSGLHAASFGTVGLYVDDEKCIPQGLEIPNLTTPDPVTLHKTMEYLTTCGVTHVAFEASSHGIDQKRLHSATLAAAAFMNFASDHLDYHGTRDAYLAAKLRLFQEILPQDGVIVAPHNDVELRNRLSSIGKKVITFGINAGCDILAKNVALTPRHTKFDLTCHGKRFNDVSVKLFGGLQIGNVLCAVALAYASGLAMDSIVDAAKNVTSLDGRMEYITTFPNGGDIYVDYAHTTDAFRHALQDFRKICTGRLICVFGCGGDRDKSKRAQMGIIASEIADIVIVTDDNPRSEDPASIRQTILSALPGAIEIGNRSDAIAHAISISKHGDVVAIIGKGHESTQTYGTSSIMLNDRDEILRIRNGPPHTFSPDTVR